MVIEGLLGQLQLTGADPRTWLWRAVDKPCNTCMHERTETHGARLDGDVQGGAAETVVAQCPGSIAQGDYFCVGGRVMGPHWLVPALTDGDTVLDDDSTDRHFTRISGVLCQRQSLLHPVFVVVGHTAPSCRGAHHTPAARAPCQQTDITGHKGMQVCAITAQFAKHSSLTTA